MQLHQLKPTHIKKQSKRVGRGGKKGTYSGRGIKGQKSRAGRRFKPVIRELIKKYPKLRGYKVSPVSKSCLGVSLAILENKFNPGETVNPQVLLERKIIRRIKGRLPEVKLLSEGKLTKPLNIESCLISKKAREIIEAAKGSIKNHGSR